MNYLRHTQNIPSTKQGVPGERASERASKRQFVERRADERVRAQHNK